jgi:hypothetical protein
MNRLPTREEHELNLARYTSSTLGMLGMASITLLQALHNKNLVIVAEICMPAELGAAGVFGKLALNNARALINQPVPGMYEPTLRPEEVPDTQMLAKQIGLDG